MFIAELNEVTTELKQRVATLIGAPGPDDIAEMANVATGINTVAQSLPLRAGDNVLVLEGDYPRKYLSLA